MDELLAHLKPELQAEEVLVLPHSFGSWWVGRSGRATTGVEVLWVGGHILTLPQRRSRKKLGLSKQIISESTAEKCLLEEKQYYK